MGKKYLFENREQLIELLSLSIELVDKHFYLYCVYYDELITMAKKKIKEISLVEMVEIDEKNMVTEIYICINLIMPSHSKIFLFILPPDINHLNELT